MVGSDDPESLIPYEEWMIDGMRRIIYLSLWQTAQNGLPGEHHFYINFKTQYPGVLLSPNLLARFPEEMRIVLQNQFQALEVDEDTFSVSLQFGGVPETLVVPLKAISQFVDPTVSFSLDFDVDVEAALAQTRSSGKGPRLVSTDGNVAHLGGTASRPTPASQAIEANQGHTEHADTASSAPTAPAGSANSDGSADGAATENVVTLDAFRQKKKDS